MTPLDPDFVKAVRERERRHNYFDMIHHVCEWKVEGYCVKHWDRNRTLSACAPSTCPLVDEAMEKEGP
jgi:hypothetical protein